MNQLFTKTLMSAAVACSLCNTANAQLSSNPDKFLGNITTSWNNDMDTDGFIFSDYWNQVTPENATKWGSVEGTRGKYNWGGADKAFNYAKEHGFLFKFHTFAWGSQFPNWLRNLTPEERYEAIVEWMDAAKEHFPELPIIDVVNEAVSGHQNDTPLIKEALGCDGKTGYDWIIKAFEMAHERWPDAILIYNDFNTFQWNTDEFIDLVKTIRDAGAPIDAYGCQSHDMLSYDGKNVAPTFKSSMDKMHQELMMPMYSTEYDVGTEDDELQLKAYKEQIPYMWEADYCAGITLWGWIYGSTWTPDGNSGLIKNKVERPALTWLREYMQTDAAKNAKSPFPGMVKEASVYVKPAAIGVESGKVLPITVNASLKTKTIDHIDLFVNDELIGTLTNAPYEAEYTPTAEGKYDIKAIVTATDGTQFERLSGFKVYPARMPYNGEKEIPGIIEAEDFDGGAELFSFHDSDNKNEGDIKDYRKDAGGVDFVKGNGGCAIGYTATGEWLDYTINVKEAGIYSYEATVSCGSGDGSAFSIDVIKDDDVVNLCKVNVTQTDNNQWSTYKVMSGEFKVPLEAGKQIIRITIDKPYVNLDKIELKLEGTGIQSVKGDGLSDNQPLYNLHGMKVDKNFKGIIIKNGQKVLNK